MCSVKFSVSTCVPVESLVMLRTPLIIDGSEPVPPSSELPEAVAEMRLGVMVSLGVSDDSSPSNSNSNASSRSSGEGIVCEP
jgi:hypothetical protein